MPMTTPQGASGSIAPRPPNMYPALPPGGAGYQKFNGPPVNTVTPGGAPASPQVGGGGPAVAASPDANPMPGGRPASPYASPYTPEQAHAQSLASGMAEKVAGGEDLTKSGVDVMKGYIAQTDPQYQADIRSAMQAAAAGGTLGSGMLKEKLLADPTGASGLATMRGKDINARAMELAGSLAPAEAQRRAGATSTLGGYAGSLYGQGEGAINTQMRQRAMQEELLNSAFGRQATTAQLGMQGAGMLGEQATGAAGGAGDLMRNLALRDAMARMYAQPRTG
jgi:hypothetical protein